MCKNRKLKWHMRIKERKCNSCNGKRRAVFAFCLTIPAFPPRRLQHMQKWGSLGQEAPEEGLLLRFLNELRTWWKKPYNSGHTAVVCLIFSAEEYSFVWEEKYFRAVFVKAWRHSWRGYYVHPCEALLLTCACVSPIPIKLTIFDLFELDEGTTLLCSHYPLCTKKPWPQEEQNSTVFSSGKRLSAVN